MNPRDTVQIEAPDFDPDIDGVSSPSADETQGTSSPTPAVTEPEDDSLTPATATQQLTSPETDWLDATPVQIPRVSSSTVQLEEQEIINSQARDSFESFKIPDLEDNSEEEQSTNLESYLAHHNTYEASQYIRQEYQSRLHDLDDDQDYAEINRAYYPQDIPAAQDYRPANQSAEPCRTTKELKRIFGRGRGQVRREELHSHQPFGPRTNSLQSCIQRKIEKNQPLCQRYANNC